MAIRTWDGGGGDALASTAANWSDNTAPVAGDAVVFDATSSKNCTFDLTADFASLNTTGYGGVVTASATTTVSGNVTLANSTWTHGSQQFVFDATGTFTTNNNSLYDVDFTDGITATIVGGMTVVRHAILINAVNTTTYNGNGSIVTMYVGGDVTATSGRASGTTSTNYVNVEMNGTGDQTFTGNTSYTNVPGKLVFNKASGIAYIAGGLIPYAGITHTTGSTNFSTNTVTTYVKDFSLSTTSFTSNSGVTLYNFTVGDSKTLTLTDLMSVANTLDIGGGAVGTTTINGSISLAGNFINTAGNQVNGTFALTFAGSNNQTWSATNTSYIIGGGAMTINKSGGTLSINGAVRWDGSIVYTAGTVDASTGTSDLKVVVAQTLNTNGMSWYDITMGANITLGSNLTLTRNWTKTAGTLSGAYAVVFNGTSTVTGATAFYSLTINSAKTVHLTSTQTFSTNASGTFTATGATLDATTPSSAAILTVNGSHSVGTVAATDIDSSAGNTVHNIGGTNTRTTNWDTTAPAAATFVGMLLMGVG